MQRKAPSIDPSHTALAKRTLAPPSLCSAPAGPSAVKSANIADSSSTGDPDLHHDDAASRAALWRRKIDPPLVHGVLTLLRGELLAEVGE